MKLKQKIKNEGMLLVELIVALLVSSIVLIVFTKAMSSINEHSADPMVYRQMQMIAQSLMEEVQSKDFNKPASGFAGDKVPENRSLFDTTTDFNGFSMSGIKNLLGNDIALLGSYNAQIEVVPEALGTIGSSDVQKITVTISTPVESLKLVGYKINYDKP